MAESTGNSGLSYPLDFSLESCVIVTALGQPTDFSKMVVEINYFEDIYNSTITGNLILNDSSGFLNMLGFSGNEYLLLSFGKPGLDTRKISKTFRIYSVSNRGMVKDQNENYILNLVSNDEVIISLNKEVKKRRKKKVKLVLDELLVQRVLTNNKIKIILYEASTQHIVSWLK